MSLSADACSASLIGPPQRSAVCGSRRARQFESRLRARLLRVISAEPSTTQVMRCDVELRPDGLQLQPQNFEMFYRWTDVVSIDDVDAGIELRFLARYVMVRARAFATADDRASFLALARSLAQSARAAM